MDYQKHAPVREAIYNALHHYIVNKANRNQRIELPPGEYVTHSNSLSAGNLGSCPRAKALSRKGINPDFPELNFRQNRSAMLKIQHGVMVEDLVQEALVDSGLSLVSDIEVNAYNEAEHLHGRIDAIIRINGEKHILELKARQSFYGQPSSPMLKYAYQVMCYGLITGITNMHIVTVEQGDVQLWSLYPDGDGYQLFRHTGEIWKNPLNMGSWLNMNTIRQMRDTILNLQEEDESHIRQLVPIYNPFDKEHPDNDPLNGDTWQCVSWIKKPKVLKSRQENGEAINNCEYQCHPGLQDLDGHIITPITEDGRITFINSGETVIKSEDDSLF